MIAIYRNKVYEVSSHTLKDVQSINNDIKTCVVVWGYSTNRDDSKRRPQHTLDV